MKRLLPIGAIAGLLLAAPAAEAAIQLDRGIAGARIGNTRAEVRAALGKPKVRTGTNDFGRWVRYRYPGGIEVFFQGGRRVTSVSTSGLGDRTAGGIGVGTSEARLRAAIKRVRCETVQSVRICLTGQLRPGRRVTDFRIVDGRVARVTVGIVID